MGAVTATIIKRQPLGGTARCVIADVTWSNSYANPAGDTFTAKLFGLNIVNAIIPASAAGASNVGYAVTPDLTNLTLKLEGGAASGVGLAQPTNASDQSGTVARVLVIGDAPYV
jgi:hypothetical protein